MVRINIGLIFRSTSFADTVEVVEIRHSEVDVRITTTQGFSRIEKNWSLEYIKACFERKEYYIPEEDKYSIW